MKTLLITAGCALLLTGCATNPANDPLQVRLNDIDSRLGNVERVVSNQSLVELSRRLDALEAQQREQRGNVEVLQNNGERRAQVRARPVHAIWTSALRSRRQAHAASSAAGAPAAAVAGGRTAGAAAAGAQCRRR